MNAPSKKRGYWVVSFAAALLVFLSVISAVSRSATNQSAAMLEKALDQIVTDTYAIEGRYPDSVKTLVEKKRFSYDPDRYMIVYDTFSDNIRPRIEVIERSGS